MRARARGYQERWMEGRRERDGDGERKGPFEFTFTRNGVGTVLWTVVITKHMLTTV